MRLLTIALIAVLTQTFTAAQTYEIGAFAGGANYIGDVGSDNIIDPQTPVLGALFKWNRSARHSFRFSALYAQIEGNDDQSAEARRQLRGYNFNSNLLELSLGLEYTFWEFAMYDGDTPATPYLYTGLTYIWHDAHRLDPVSDQLVADSADRALVLPMVLGFKKALRGPFVIGIEAGARYAFTDNLDGSAPDSANTQAIRFGNINNDDWYLFMGITVTYTFGKKPCFCAF